MDPKTKQLSQSVITEEFRKFIEVEVLKIIKDLAQKGQTPQERIQQIAQITLDLVRPGLNLEELYQNAVKLDDAHSELAPVVFKLMREYEQKYEKKAISQVSLLMKQGRFDDAQDMVKKVLEFKVEN